MPSPGEVAAHDLGDDLTVLIENTRTSGSSVRSGSQPAIPTITYTFVDVVGAARVHAAIVKHHTQRSVVSRSTL